MAATCLVGHGAILDVMKLAPASSADISLLGLTPPGVSDSILDGTVANEMARLVQATQYRETHISCRKADLIANLANITLLWLLSVWTVGDEVLWKPLSAFVQNRTY